MHSSYGKKKLLPGVLMFMSACLIVSIITKTVTKVINSLSLWTVKVCMYFSVDENVRLANKP